MQSTVLPPISLPSQKSITSPKQGHQLLGAASAWLLDEKRHGRRIVDNKIMYTTKGGSFTARSFSRMTEPAKKLVMASGSLTARDQRKIGHDETLGSPERLTAPLNQQDRELMRLLDQVALKIAEKGKSCVEAFRGLDPDHDGKITREEASQFFLTYGMTLADVERVLVHFEASEKDDLLDFQFFQSFLRPFISAAVAGTKWADQIAAADQKPIMEYNKSQPVDRGKAIEAVRREFHEVLFRMGQKAKLKFLTVRKAFRCVNLEAQGQIPRSDMRYFFRVFNIDENIADQFHNRMDFNGTGEVDYDDFFECMRVYLMPDYEAQMHLKHQAPVAKSSAEDVIPDPAEMNNTTFRSTWNASIQSFKRGVDPKLVKELCSVMAEIGEKIPMSFRNPRDAFRDLDLQKTGRITRAEMHNFFRLFNRTDEIADKVFDLLEPEGIGYIEYDAFLSHFDEVLNPAFKKTDRTAIMPVEELGRSRQVADVINAIGERMITKYRDAQHAFRDLDLDRDGKVSQLEVRIFARKMGLTTESADSFFAAMGNHADESGSIPYKSFINLFRELRGDVAESTAASKLSRFNP